MDIWILYGALPPLYGPYTVLMKIFKIIFKIFENFKPFTGWAAETLIPMRAARAGCCKKTFPGGTN